MLKLNGKVKDCPVSVAEGGFWGELVGLVFRNTFQNCDVALFKILWQFILSHGECSTQSYEEILFLYINKVAATSIYKMHRDK